MVLFFLVSLLTAGHFYVSGSIDWLIDWLILVIFWYCAVIYFRFWLDGYFSLIGLIMQALRPRYSRRSFSPSFGRQSELVMSFIIIIYNADNAWIKALNSLTGPLDRLVVVPCRLHDRWPWSKRCQQWARHTVHRPRNQSVRPYSRLSDWPEAVATDLSCVLTARVDARQRALTRV